MFILIWKIISACRKEKVNVCVKSCIVVRDVPSILPADKSSLSLTNLKNEGGLQIGKIKNLVRKLSYICINLLIKSII